jgi:hypothetical protein
MAEIEIGPLADRLAEDELRELAGKLDKIGAPRLPPEPEGEASVLASVDGDILVEFLDRLEAHDLACDIYLPVEFEGRVELGDYRVGSAAALVDVLEELKDDMAPEEDEDEESDEDEEDDDYGDMKLIEEKLRRLWKVVFDGAHTAIDRRLPLYVLSD